MATWEDILDEYDAGEFYDDYIKEFVEENISSEVLEETMKVYLESDEADERTFEFWVSEYGFTDGTHPMDFGYFSDEEFPMRVLASEIEEFWYKTGEYDAEWKYPWVAEATDRWLTIKNIRDSLDSGDDSLLNAVRGSYIRLPVGTDKALTARVETLINEIKERNSSDCPEKPKKDPKIERD